MLWWRTFITTVSSALGHFILAVLVTTIAGHAAGGPLPPVTFAVLWALDQLAFRLIRKMGACRSTPLRSLSNGTGSFLVTLATSFRAVTPIIPVGDLAVHRLAVFYIASFLLLARACFATISCLFCDNRVSSVYSTTARFTANAYGFPKC